ncbi:MAG TPA: hypothetical protein VK356_08145 [Thermomicrobiales bacterium]|nr:hypothetical protein [Thermomicrobiales bacterium]
MIGQLLVQGVAEVPAMSQVQAGCLDQLTLRANPFEEHDQLELEKDNMVDARSPSLGVALLHPVADETEIEFGLQVTVEVFSGNKVLQRDGDRLVEATRLFRGRAWRTPGLGETLMARRVVGEPLARTGDLSLTGRYPG